MEDWIIVALIGSVALLSLVYERVARHLKRRMRGSDPWRQSGAERKKVAPVWLAPDPAKPGVQRFQGPAWVVDGDTIDVAGTRLRLFGIDAPEMQHPYGEAAKWAMVYLCKGQTVTAEIVNEDAHGRVVARCFLPDGRDLSAELVRQGLALDWPKFSRGAYRQLEVPGIRKKLWLADARQKGHMHVWAQYEARKKAQP